MNTVIDLLFLFFSSAFFFLPNLFWSFRGLSFVEARHSNDSRVHINCCLYCCLRRSWLDLPRVSGRQILLSLRQIVIVGLFRAKTMKDTWTEWEKSVPCQTYQVQLTSAREAALRVASWPEERERERERERKKSSDLVYADPVSRNSFTYGDLMFFCRLWTKMETALLVT